MIKKSYIAVIILIVITLVWGVSFPLIRNAISNIPDETYIFFRFFVAMIVVSPIVILRKKYISKTILVKGFFLGITLFLTMFLTVNALYYTSSVNVSFFTGASVVLVPLLWMIYTRKVIDSNQILGVIGSTIGICFLIGNINLRFNYGDLLGIILSFSVASQIILTGIFTKSEDALLIGVFQIVSCMFLSLFYWGIKGFRTVPLNTAITIAVLVTGIFSTALAFTLQTVAQKYTSPTKTAVIFSCEPVFGAIFSTIIAKSDGTYESISFFQLIGCIMIFLSIMISEKIILKRHDLFRKKKRIQKGKDSYKELT